ncbi:MAG: YafY family transcriptional regulator [Ruminococcus sp.]|nr:YafY family transcriptional regulator [Ruminococcus sp.]
MKIDRLVSIIITLLDKKRIAAKKLADMYEVSLRTIYRDIDTINIAGIPIRAVSGTGGGFEIMPQYKLDKNVFSADDLSAIFTGLTGVSSLMRNAETTNALVKIKSLFPPEQASEIELKANQISIDVTPWFTDSTAVPIIEIIKTALTDSKLISFDYVGRFGKKTARTVESYQLVFKANRWYLYGYCLLRNDFRLFCLSRILSINLENETFTARNFPKPQLQFADILSDRQINIKLRIHSSLMDRILDFYAFESFIPDGEEHFIADFPFIENDYYYSFLLSFGNKCECLEPESVRSELAKRANEIYMIYEK